MNNITSNLFTASATTSESILTGGIVGIVVTVAVLLFAMYRSDRALTKELDRINSLND